MRIKSDNNNILVFILLRFGHYIEQDNKQKFKMLIFDNVYKQILDYFCGMQILDGKIVSQSIKDTLKEKTILFKHNGNKTPHLAAVLVGSNGASETYVASKVKNCEEVGFSSSLIRLDENITETELVATIEKLNNDVDVDGILVQLPLPKQIDEEKIKPF